MQTKFNVGDEVFVSRIDFGKPDNIGNLKIKIITGIEKISEIKIIKDCVIYYFGSLCENDLHARYENECFSTKEEIENSIRKNITNSLLNLEF